ncbi:MAG: hypothetical protein U5L11_10090 [Arhodomonas sp.]|nr:hypothetical protein [Arhodomonas sp.]
MPRGIVPDARRRALRRRGATPRRTGRLDDAGTAPMTDRAPSRHARGAGGAGLPSSRGPGTDLPGRNFRAGVQSLIS